MNRSKVIILATVLLLIIGGALFFSTRNSKEPAPSNKIQVTASFYPLAYIASEVGGLRVSVRDLLPPGGEPHDFEPSPRDFALLSKSDLLIYNGASFEPWVDKWTKSSFERPKNVVAMVNELGKRGAPLMMRGGAVDPHVWLDPLLFEQEINIVRDALIAVDPVHTDEYRANANTLLARVSDLDQRFREGLRSCADNTIIASHDAFGYIAREYHFSVISIAGISPDEEPSPKVLASIVEAVRAKNIKYIFFETTVSPKLSEAIAREVKGKTLVLNPLESLTTDEVQSKEDYLSIMTMNLKNLRTALSCN